MRLDQDVDHVTVLIDGTPQVLLLAIESPDEDLVQMPVVAKPSLSSLQFPGIVRTELLTPAPDGLIGHDDSPLGEKILDISKAQAEPMVSPDRIADDRGRKSIARSKKNVHSSMALLFQARAQVDNTR